MVRRRKGTLDAGLAKAIKQTSQTLFYTAGSWPLSEPMKLLFHHKVLEAGGQEGAAQLDEPLAGGAVGCLELNGGALSAEDTTVQQLLEAATPAAFGRGRETVTDPTYRSALELLPSAIALISPSQLPPPEVLADIHSLLQPAAHSVSAQLHKVNIYKASDGNNPAGFFKSHIDTPRSEAMFGSLVVCLPSAFEGGQLVLKHKGVKHVCEWGSQQQQQQQEEGQQEEEAGAEVQAAAGTSTSAAAAADVQVATTGPLLHWAAFYSDVEHEILKVTSGFRITLTFNLFHVPATPAAAGQGLLHAADVASMPVYGMLQQLLGTAAWHPMGTKLGFLLEHKYAAGIRGLNDANFPGILKGADRLLYAAMAGAGLKVKVVPLYKTWWDDFWVDMAGEEDAMTEEECILDGIRIGSSFDKDARKMSCAVMGEGDAAEFARQIGAHTADELGVTWCGTIDKESFWYRDDVRGWGNESQTDTFYSAAGLLVTIPAWGTAERAAALGAAGAADGDNKGGERGEQKSKGKGKSAGDGKDVGGTKKRQQPGDGGKGVSKGKARARV